MQGKTRLNRKNSETFKPSIKQNKIMGKVIQIEVPDWVDEEKLRSAIVQAISCATKELPIEEVRKILGIRLEDLTEELEVEDIEKLREREKDRLKWLY